MCKAGEYTLVNDAATETVVEEVRSVLANHLVGVGVAGLSAEGAAGAWGSWKSDRLAFQGSAPGDWEDEDEDDEDDFDDDEDELLPDDDDLDDDDFDEDEDDDLY